MGRQAPRERRAHLFAVIEKMTREGPQGETGAPGGRIAHLCSIASLSRASYYRWLEPKLSARDDADLRDLIQRLALRRRHEGYRRITRRLRDEGLVVNAKRVLRLMRADNLLSLRRRPFVAPTTESRHPFPIAPNLARGLVPTGLDQLWVADIILGSSPRTGSMSGWRRLSSISPSSSTPSRAEWWDGRSTTISRRAWPWTRSTRRSPRAIRRPASSITPIAAERTLRANTRRGSTSEAFSAA